jgi:sugar phosphate isomerase/epimerase
MPSSSDFHRRYSQFRRRILGQSQYSPYCKEENTYVSNPTASIQLIVFGGRNQSDLPGVLGEVAQAGFPAIEAWNLFASHGEAAAKEMLARNNLKVSGAHFGYGEFADEAKLSTNLAYCKAVGTSYLMCSGVADSKTVDGYRTSAKLFNDVGRRAKDIGVSFNYHNHAWEFDDLGGINGMELLTAETDPDLVKFNIDVFWVWYGNADPADFIAEHADRAGYYHFKDGKRRIDENGNTRPHFLELGTGEVNLRAAYAAAIQADPKWITAEQDSTELTPLASATISRKFLREALGI